MALLAVVLCVNFAACSDDDENEPSVTPTLAGTTWKIIAIDDEEDEDWKVGSTLTFKTDGTIMTYPYSDDAEWEATYHLSDNELIIDFYVDGHVDDYVAGTISINGKTATYRYKWYDYDGSDLDDGKQYNMTLQKQ